MRKEDRWPLVIVGTLVTLGIGAGLWDAVRSARREVISKAFPAPEFEAATEDGTLINLDSYKGKVVLIDFFASWCKPCEQLMPPLVAAASPLADRGLVMLAASGDDDEPDRVSKVRAFFGRVHVAPPQVVFPTRATMERYGVEGFPTTILVDRAGQARVLGHWGYSEVQLRATLERALATSAPAGDGG